MKRNSAQSKVICAPNTFSLYALTICDSTKPLVNLQSLERFLQIRNTEMRCSYAD